MSDPSPKGEVKLVVEPAPSALDRWLKDHADMCSGAVDETCHCGRNAALIELHTLRSDLATALKERDALQARLDSIDRNLLGAMTSLHGGRVRVIKVESN